MGKYILHKWIEVEHKASEQVTYCSIQGQHTLNRFGKLLKDNNHQDMMDYIQDRVINVICRIKKNIHRDHQ